MKILQNCIVDLLKVNGIEEDYLDNWSDGMVIYYYGGVGGIQITFRGSCVPFGAAKEYLSLFGLAHLSSSLKVLDCKCDWT